MSERIDRIDLSMRLITVPRTGCVRIPLRVFFLSLSLLFRVTRESRAKYIPIRGYAIHRSARRAKRCIGYLVAEGAGLTRGHDDS